MALKEDTGMGTQIELPYVNSLVIAVFLGIAIYNVLELTILIQTFFKRRSGLYYYSLLVSNFGIFFHALTNLLKFYELNYSVPGHTIANTVIAWISWVAMITGQSVVLWSRLHLVARSSMTRWVLVLIIVDAVVLHTSTGVLTFLTNLSKDPSRWKRPYAIVERIQVVLFFLQEVLISSIYIWKTAVMLRAEGPLLDANRNVRGKKGKRVLGHTIAMSVIIIALDITLIAVQFSGCKCPLSAPFTSILTKHTSLRHPNLLQRRSLLRKTKNGIHNPKPTHRARQRQCPRIRPPRLTKRISLHPQHRQNRRLAHLFHNNRNRAYTEFLHPNGRQTTTKSRRTADATKAHRSSENDDDRDSARVKLGIPRENSKKARRVCNRLFSYIFKRCFLDVGYGYND